MPEDKLKTLLQAFKEGSLTEDAFLQQLQKSHIENLQFANVDHHRAIRQGFPEVIFCEGKTARQIHEIAEKIYQRHGLILATHADENIFNYLKLHFPDLLFEPASKCIHTPFPKENPVTRNAVGIITAGTSDIPVAEEAAVTLRMFKISPLKIFDVGVAGIHRLNQYWEQIQETYVLIVVAGMEGALPSVVGGLTDKPVIGVPTSMGYGTHLKGLAPLLAMLNSCSNNVTVLNVDNGFGAGYVAALFTNQLVLFHEKMKEKSDE